MNFIALRALVRNDLRIFVNDRRAVIIGILVPILISAFFGYVFGGGGARNGAGTIAVAIVNEDAAPLSERIASALALEPMFTAMPLSRAQADAAVRSGKTKVAVVIPKGFAESAVKAFFVPTDKPTIELLLDPSDAMSGQVVQGLLTQHAVREISKEAFSGRSTLLQQGLSIPYRTKSTMLAAAGSTPYNAYAHSFAGMAVQFILLAGVDAGVLLLLLRERGIWQRIRSAPLSRTQLLFARAVGTTLVSLFQFAAIYLAAVLIFGVRIQGSVLGFLAIGFSFSLVNASFGLMLAALGRSAPATRGLAAMAALLLVMIGGAWVPAFVFPKWLQQASLIAPTRWAIDGLDAVTWRGLGFDAAIGPVLVLLATAAVCMSIAIWRFRWEE